MKTLKSGTESIEEKEVETEVRIRKRDSKKKNMTMVQKYEC